MKKALLLPLCLGITSLLSAQNWTPMAPGLLPDNYIVYSISAIGDKILWAVASGVYIQGPIPNTHHPKVLRTSDGGLSWSQTEVSEAAGTISFQIVAVDSLTAWITTQDYGDGPGRALYKTTDGGLTWFNKLSGSSGGVGLNRFADGQHWVAHNRQTMALSADNGATWVNKLITGYNTNEYQLVASGANMTSTVGDTLWNGTSNGRILRMTNYGEAFQFIPTNLGTSTIITSVAFQDHRTGLCQSVNAVGNNRIARSTNGGANWSVLAIQPGSSVGWNIAPVPDAPGFYVLVSDYSNAAGQVAITTNSGDTWSVENLNGSLNAVTFVGPSTGWIGAGRIASSTSPAIFKYTGSPLVGTRDELPALSGFAVSPNPATDRIQFDFDGYAQAQTVTASLRDAEGRLVLRAESLYTGVLNTAHLPAGLYVLTVQTEKGVAVQKIIIE